MLAHPPLLEILGRLDLALIRILQRPLLLPLQTLARPRTLQSLPRLLLLKTLGRPARGHPQILLLPPHLLSLQTPIRLLILQSLPLLLPLQNLNRPGQATPPNPQDLPRLKILIRPSQVHLRIPQDLPPPLVLRILNHPGLVRLQILPHFILPRDSHTSLACSKYHTHIFYNHPRQKGYIL